MAHDILIVDDEADIRILTAGILEDEGYQTREAHNSSTAIEAVEVLCPGLVLLDIWLENSQIDGMELLARWHETHPNLPVIMISGHGNIETAVSAINLGACDFIEKPFTADRLILIVNRAIETARLRRENLELRLRTGGGEKLVGSSTIINHLRQVINKVAPTNSRALISGPAGSGKDVVARLIHSQSNRSNGPFISLNCAAMQPENFEVSLFGHAPSLLSIRREIGTFERAHMGTLFLDEVVDMPLETQGKIVRALQEQTFQRVGSAVRIAVDVRVIATSSQNLAEAMAQDRFREDLFYRLSVVPIRIPPLRDHREDIPALVKHFVQQMAASYGWNPQNFTQEAVATLQSYQWPGNVRELRNMVERILIMTQGSDATDIHADMIPAEVDQNTSPSNILTNHTEIIGLPLREAREKFEREYLISQVSRFGGNISRTATFIGMERSALHRKLKSLGIQSEDRIRVANN